MNDSCFLRDLPAFEAWAERVDVWTSRRSTWLMDLNSRSVEVTAGGAVTIHPDEHGSTRWFVDLMAENGWRGSSLAAPVRPRVRERGDADR